MHRSSLPNATACLAVLLMSGCSDSASLDEPDTGTTQQPASSIHLSSKLFDQGEIAFRFDTDDFPTTLTMLRPQLSWSGHSACLGLTFPSSSEYLDSSGGGVAAACEDVRQTLRAMRMWQDRVPALRFEHDTSPSGDFIEIYARGSGFCAWNRIKGASGAALNLRDHIGNQSGANYLRLSKDGNCATSGILHELGHGLGLWHTQGRADRNSFVLYDSSNLRFGWSTQYIRNPTGFSDIGPFDFESLMLYDSFAGSERRSYSVAPDSVTQSGGDLLFTVQASLFDGTAFQDEHFDNWAIDIVPRRSRFGDNVTTARRGIDDSFVISVPLADLGTDVAAASLADREDPSNYRVRREGPHADRPAMVVAGGDIMADEDITFTGGTWLSAGDISAVFHNYSQWHDDASPPAHLERHGDALVYGDFDGDGVDDLAVSAPGDTAGSSVIVYRGVYDATDTGRIVPMPWHRIALRAWSLASGDLNGDGIDELIVGNDGGDPAELGRVDIFMGRPDQSFALSGEFHYDIEMSGAWKIAHAPSLPPGFGTAPGTKLGYALAVGDLNGDDADDLVVGMPGADAVHYDASNDPPMPPGDWPNNYQRTGAALAYFGVKSPDRPGVLCTEDDECAVACDTDEFQCVTTSACTSDADCGLGECLSGGSCSKRPLVPFDGALDPYQTPVKGSHHEAKFGTALAIADLNEDGTGEIVVGAPNDYQLRSLGIMGNETHGDHTGAPISVGQAYVFRYRAYAGASDFVFETQISRDILDSEFGTSLAVNNDHLFVGAPADDQDPDGQGAAVGAVHVFDRREMLGFSSSFVTTIVPSLFSACVHPGDRFGEVLASGALDGSGDIVLAIGAPSKNRSCTTLLPPEAGEGAVYVLLPDLSAGQVVFSPNPALDPFGRFGGALAFRDRNARAAECASSFVNGQLELAVGAPGESHTVDPAISSGVAWLIEGTGTTVSSSVAVEQRLP